MALIAKNNPNYSQKQIDKIRYGLEGIYLTITKAVILIAICWFLGILKEFIIFTILFNGMRMFAFGLHASKSYLCLISSGLIFTAGPYLAAVITMNYIFKVIIWLICLYMVVLYAPADTHKRPIVNIRKRRRFKVLAILVSIAYGVLALIIGNQFLSNCLLFTMIAEVLMILPISYKLLKMPYNNYKYYIKGFN